MDMREWGADIQTWGDKAAQLFNLDKSEMYHVQQLIFENYSGFKWYIMNTSDVQTKAASEYHT